MVLAGAQASAARRPAGFCIIRFACLMRPASLRLRLCGSGRYVCLFVVVVVVVVVVAVFALIFIIRIFVNVATIEGGTL